MHQDIMSWPSMFLYDNLLEADSSVASHLLRYAGSIKNSCYVQCVYQVLGHKRFMAGFYLGFLFLGEVVGFEVHLQEVGDVPRHA